MLSLTRALCCCAGMFRLVKYLSEDHLLGKKSRVKFVVDAGTGTSAVGLGVAAMSLGLGFVHKDFLCVCFFSRSCYTSSSQASMGDQCSDVG